MSGTSIQICNGAISQAPRLAPLILRRHSKSSVRRIVITDHGSFVLLNVYVPNAGKKEEAISDRADLKIRFLHALKEKCDSLREDGRKVLVKKATGLIQVV